MLKNMKFILNMDLLLLFYYYFIIIILKNKKKKLEVGTLAI